MKCINKSGIIKFLENNVSDECWKCDYRKEEKNGDLICAIFKEEVDVLKKNSRLKICKEFFEVGYADKL